MFDGTHSPAPQSFGLDIFKQLTSNSLDRIECFLFDRELSRRQKISPAVSISPMSVRLALCRVAISLIELRKGD